MNAAKYLSRHFRLACYLVRYKIIRNLDRAGIYLNSSEIEEMVGEGLAFVGEHFPRLFKRFDDPKQALLKATTQSAWRVCKGLRFASTREPRQVDVLDSRVSRDKVDLEQIIAKFGDEESQLTVDNLATIVSDPVTLRLLSLGENQHTIARLTGVSVRTVRRRVCRIKFELEQSSAIVGVGKLRALAPPPAECNLMDAIVSALRFCLELPNPTITPISG